MCSGGLRALSELEDVTEKPMAIGMGIDYPLPRPLPKSFGSADYISLSCYKCQACHPRE